MLNGNIESQNKVLENLEISHCKDNFHPNYIYLNYLYLLGIITSLCNDDSGVRYLYSLQGD